MATNTNMFFLHTLRRQWALSDSINPGRRVVYLEQR